MLTSLVSLDRLLLVRMGTGDDILLGIREAVAANQIRSAVILGGAGSVSTYHYHVVKDSTFPLEDRFVSGEEALDIVSVMGLVMDGRVHAHLTMANKDKAVGGHMEEGCHVLSFAVVVLGDLGDASLSGWDSIGQL